MIADYHTVRVWAGSTELDVILDEPGSITLDESYAPFVQGTINVATPTDLSIIDPSTPSRITIRLEQTYDPSLPDRIYHLDELHGITGTLADFDAYYGITGTLADFDYTLPVGYTPGTAREFDLHIRSASHRLIDGTTTLRFASDELLWQDKIAVNVGVLGGVIGSIVDPVTYIPSAGAVIFDYRSLARIAKRVDTTNLPVLAELADTTLIPTGLDPSRPTDQYFPFEAGESLYDAIDALAQQLGVRMVSEGTFGVQFVSRDRTIDGTITLDGTTNLLEFTIAVDRDHSDWYDSVVIPLDEDGISFVGNRGTKGYKSDVEKVRKYKGITDYWRAGGELVSALTNRADKRLMRSPATAVSRYDAIPGQAVAIDTGSRTFTAVAESVEWQIGGAWTMTITCRDLLETTP